MKSGNKKKKAMRLPSARLIIVFSVLLLLLASFSYAQDDGAEVVGINDIVGPATGGYWAWASLAGMALIASSIILVFMYAWGTMFRNNELISYVKIEFYELVVTALLIFVVLGIANSIADLRVSGLIPASLIPTPSGVIDGFECYVAPSDTIYMVTERYFHCVEDDFASWLNMNYILNMYTDMAASVTPYSRPMGIGLISSPLAGMASPLKQLLYNATTALTIAYIINYAQYYTFLFAVNAFLFYYLPIGVFLRSFLPTRRLGGTIIGICLSFLLIFPLLTTFAFFIFYNPSGSMESFRSFLTSYFSTEDFGNTLAQFFDPNQYGGFAEFLTGALGGLGEMLQNIFGSIFLVAMVFPISVVGRAFIIGYVVPAFNIMVFVQATVSLSKSFGEEIDIGALTRMI